MAHHFTIEGNYKNMEVSRPWELPVEVVDLVTDHVVGKIYRDGDFIIFRRSGDSYYDLKPEGAVMKTIHGFHIRLASEQPNLGIATWGKLLNQAIFDECLYGSTEWQLSEPHFEEMILPCNNLMEYLQTQPASEEHMKDGSMMVKAWNTRLCEFVLPQTQVKGYVKLTYEWSSKTFEEQRFLLQAALVLSYDNSIALSAIKQHEERLRSFLDFIWFRGHKSGEIFVKNGDQMAKLYRRSSLGAEVKAAAGMDLRNFLGQNNLGDWIQQWFSLSEEVHRAIDPIITVARNPGTVSDLKLVMTVHATDALIGILGKSNKKTLGKRLSEGIGERWKFKMDLNGEALSDYIARVVATRNEIVKAARHIKATDASFLRPQERTRAYFECLLLHRSLFLELMNIEREEIDAFVESGFRKIALTEFRYYRD